MLTKPLRVGGSTSVRIAAVLALVAGLLTVLFTQASAVAAPCNLPLGCGPPDIGTVDNCAGNAVCGDGNQGPAPPAGGGPNGNGAPTVNPAQVALTFPPPPIKVHTAPGRANTGTTYAKLLTYLWVTGWSPPAYVDQGTGIEIRAKAKYADWNLIETTQKRCYSAGSRTSAQCSYTYRKSSPRGGHDAYRISATVNFRVFYRCTRPAVCTGQGEAGEILAADTYDLKVGEMQAITTHG